MNSITTTYFFFNLRAVTLGRKSVGLTVHCTNYVVEHNSKSNTHIAPIWYE